MKTTVSVKLTFIIILAAFIIGIVLYPHLPIIMATHWNGAGVVNGYMPKFWGTFLIPLVMFFVAMLLYGAPNIDPRKEDSGHFRNEYNGFVVFFTGFLLYLYILSLYANLGYVFNMVQFLLPALAIMWFLVGEMLPRVKRNWFIGIRVPWTLRSESVWKKTHVFGGFLFQLAAFATLVGVFFPGLSLWFVIAPIAVAAIVPIIYSFVISR